MRSLVFTALLALLALPASAQYVALEPMESPLGGSATSVLTLEGGVVLLSQNGHVLRSDDDGETWVRVKAPTEAYAFPYLAKGSSGTVVASAGMDPTSIPFSFVASRDAGRTWVTLSEAELRTALALRHPSAGWFAAQSFLQTPDNAYGNVLLRSTDGGSKWALSWPSLSDTPGSTASGRRAFIGPDGSVWGNTNSSYRTDATYEEHRLSRWNVSAGTWEPGITLPGTFAGSAAGSNGKGVVLSRRSSNIYIHTSGWIGGVRATVDGGTTWSLADPAVVGVEEAAGAAVATPDGRFLVGMSGGVVSWDGQGTWRRDGLNGVPIASMAVSASGTVFAASPAKGLYRRSPGATAWTHVLPSAVTAPVLALSDDGRFAATGAGLWCYDGQSWLPVDGDTVGVRTGSVVGIAGTARGTAVVRLAGDSPGGPDRQPAVATAACAGTNGSGDGIVVVDDQTVVSIDGNVDWRSVLMRSTDGGHSFARIEDGWTQTRLFRGAGDRLYTTAWRFVQEGPSIRTEYRVFRSSDQGQTWAPFDTTRTYNRGSWVYPHPTRATLYRKTIRVGSSEAPFGLDVSNDDGQTWQSRSVFMAGTDADRTAHIRIEPLSGRLFRTSDPDRFGWTILSSSDDGRTWVDLGIAAARWPFAFDAAGRMIVASSESGLLRSAWPVDAETSDAPAAAGLRVWPSPTRGPVRIDAGTPDPVEATVHDVLGRVVARLSGAGDGLAWDASAAPVGVYVVRVVGEGGAAQTARVIVAR